MVVIFGAHSSLLFKAFHRQHSGIAPLLPLQVMMSANVDNHSKVSRSERRSFEGG